MEEEMEESQEAPPPKEYIPSSLTLRGRMSIVNEIARTLTPRQKELFQCTCFGPWLQLQQTSGDPALTHLFLQHMINEDELPIGIQRGEQELWFYFPPFHYARFRREEFCLVTGLRFGRHDSFGPYIQNIRGPLWVFNVFPGYNKGGDSLKVSDFEKVLQEGRSGGLSDIDFVRLCLILLVEVGFTGKQSTQNVSPDMLSLAENLEAFNVFPWGSYLWRKVYEQLSGSRAKLKEGEGRQYTLIGFIWAFKIWIYEAFPHMNKYAKKMKNVIPRAILIA